VNTSSDTQHQSTTPDPGVTTPPTDEQRTWESLTWPAICEHNGMRAEKHAFIPDMQGFYCGYCGIDKRDYWDAQRAQGVRA